jgi:hypothetical protein
MPPQNMLPPSPPNIVSIEERILDERPGQERGSDLVLAADADELADLAAYRRVAATGGLGYLIMQAGDYLNTALVFSGIIAIAILGLALDACLRGLLLLADPSRRG